MIPQIEAMDLMCMPLEEVDCKIFITELINRIAETQPLLYRYFNQLALIHGEHACLAGLITFKAIESTLERNENGFF